MESQSFREPLNLRIQLFVWQVISHFLQYVMHSYSRILNSYSRTLGFILGYEVYIYKNHNLRKKVMNFCYLFTYIYPLNQVS